MSKIGQMISKAHRTMKKSIKRLRKLRYINKYSFQSSSSHFIYCTEALFLINSPDFII